MDTKRVELAPLRPFHILRLWTAHLVRTSSAKPHLYDIIHPSKHPDNRTHCLPSRYNKGMSCIHTIYGALTTQLCFWRDDEIVQISTSQNTKRIVNAFLIHESKCRLLAVAQPIASSLSAHICQSIYLPLKQGKDIYYLLQWQICRMTFSVF